MSQELEDFYVGILPFYHDIHEVRTSFFLEGLNVFLVTAMGDTFVLLQYNNKREIETSKKENEDRWNANFKKVRTPDKVAVKRRVWLQIFGILLHVWE